MTIAQHSSKSDSWGTPVEIIEAARTVLGTIDLDPASSPEWNKTVRATRIITAEQDGLTTKWPFLVSTPNVFLNPPGGKYAGSETRSLPVAFWSRLMHEREHRRLGHAVFVGFTLEILSTTQGKTYPSAMAFPFCVPSKRLRFNTLRTDAVTGEKFVDKGDSPTHANAIIYVPGVMDYTDRFRQVFSEFGACK